MKENKMWNEEQNNVIKPNSETAQWPEFWKIKICYVCIAQQSCGNSIWDPYNRYDSGPYNRYVR